MTGLAARLLWITMMLVGLPLSGALLSGNPLATYLHFPPEQRLEHAAFAWPAFFLVGAVCALMVLVLVIWLGRDLRRRYAPAKRGDRRWPWWSWPALAGLLTSWVLAWSRFEWFAACQPYTFIPLWLSYIVLVNGLTQRLAGTSPLSRHPVLLAGLFPLSALFWWYFEYLNRFVQNWVYIGVEQFSATQYVLHSTLAFSTVLPAVMTTTTLLQVLLRPAPSPLTFGIATPARRRIAAGVLLMSAIILASLSLLPNYLFPFLWIAPLLVLLASEALITEPAYLALLRRRGWQILYLPALAALVCGFFWELWNFYSAAKWSYSLPFVDRYRLFEMPILGYAGYLPFGVECAVISSLVSTKLLTLDTRSPATQGG